MDRNVTAAARYFADEEAAHEQACYRAAHANGLTTEQADECDDGTNNCPQCPFQKSTPKAWNDWESHFLWWPRKVDGRWRWLSSVQRKLCAGGCALYGDFWWEYRA